MKRLDRPAVSRRGFMQASAALTLAASTRSRAQTTAPARVRVGIIGCRNRGWQLAQEFTGSGRFEIAALCDCDTAMHDQAMKELKQRGVEIRPRLLTDFRRLLDDPEIDAVVVAVPDHWHALMTVMALEAGKHVFVEKPASYNIADGRAMVAAAARHPRLAVQVGTQQRSGTQFLEARAFVAAGGLGKVDFCMGWATFTRGLVPRVPDASPPETLDYEMWVGPAPMRPYNPQLHHYNWHFVRDWGTGDMGNWGAHWLDSIRHIMDLDLPTEVFATGGHWADDAKEWPDTQTVHYSFPQVPVAWELRSWKPYDFCGRNSMGLQIRGEKGWIYVNRDRWEFHPREGGPVIHPGGDMTNAHAIAFAEAVAGRGRPAATIEDGHKSAVLCHLGNLAAVLGRRLRFDPASETIINDDQAQAMTSRPYREPWQMPA